MNIITIYTKPIKGGCFARLCKMITALATEKNKVHYLSTVEFPLRQPNIIFHKVPLVFEQKCLFYPQFFLFSLFLLPFLMLRHKIDCMVVFGTQYTLTGFFGKILLHVKIITFLRGDWVSELRAKKKPELFILWIMIIEKVALMISSKIISVNEDLTKKYILRYGKFRIGILTNNIDTSKFYPRQSKESIYKEFFLPNDTFLVGFIGTFDKIKRIDLLIQAFKKLSSSNTKLLLIGEGIEVKSLKNMVMELHLENTVIFTGWRDDIPDILSAIDLLILPSDYEGCPGIILESLGCDTPVIGSDVGGISEILCYPELLFESGDRDALSEKIISYSQNEQLYNHIRDLCQIRKNFFIFDWNFEINKIIKEN